MSTKTQVKPLREFTFVGKIAGQKDRRLILIPRFVQNKENLNELKEEQYKITIIVEKV